jgi:Rps23 Pro-64 3,4-dihydroxylase Tpa1-like proline 4-hydroxylase
MASRAERLLGRPGTGWHRFSLTPWSYPAGSQLASHNDGPGACPPKVASIVWYVHPSWGISWGGELLIIDREGTDLARSAAALGDVDAGTLLSRVSAEAESAVLSSGPDPVCIPARPNRVVIFKSDTYHTVRRVDPAAGDRMRCSFTGFFLGPPAV